MVRLLFKTSTQEKSVFLTSLNAVCHTEKVPVSLMLALRSGSAPWTAHINESCGNFDTSVLSTFKYILLGTLSSPFLGLAGNIMVFFFVANIFNHVDTNHHCCRVLFI